MKKIKPMFIAILIVLIFCGCALKKSTITKPVRTKPLTTDLESCVNSLCEQVIHGIQNTPYQTGRIILISGSLKKGVRFTKLDYHLFESLKRKLIAQNILVIEPNRNDWIRLEQDIPPLTISGNLLILELNLEPLVEINQLTVYVDAYIFSNNKKEPFPEASAQVNMDFSPISIARKLYNATSAFIPLPLGTQQNPYESFEQLAHNLVNEAFEKYTLAGERAAVDIYCICMDPNDYNLLREQIENCLIERGITITIARQDFRKVAEHLRFIHTHQIFRIKRPEIFKPATMYVFVKAQPAKKERSVIYVSLKVLWLGGGNYLHGVVGYAYVKYAIESSGNSQIMLNIKRKVWNYIYSYLGIMNDENLKNVINRKIENMIEAREHYAIISKSLIYCQIIRPLTCWMVLNCEYPRIHPPVSHLDLESLRQVTYMAIEDQFTRYAHTVIRAEDRGKPWSCGGDQLPRLQNAGDLEHAISGLRNPDWCVRWRAAERLGIIGDASVVEPLTAALKDSNLYVRWKAAEALTRIKDVGVAKSYVLIKATPQINWFHISHGYLLIRATIELNTLTERSVPIREQAEIRCLPKVMEEGMKRAVIKAARKGAYRIVVRILEGGLG